MKFDAGPPVQPQIIPRAGSGLGIRPKVGVDGDIPVVDGLVHPRTGGLSTSSDPMEVPPYRLPKRHGGPNDKHELFEIETDALGPNLVHRQDGEAWHYVLEPSVVMAFADFENAVRATRPLWRPT